jgi:acid stress-induced BolA-like protein IbaG/YrbA
MTMQADEIKRLIEQGIANSAAHIEGDGTHFTAKVVSPAFANQSRLQKQQLVYDTLKAPLADGTLHAIAIKTYTPDEWQELVNK